MLQQHPRQMRPFDKARHLAGKLGGTPPNGKQNLAWYTGGMPPTTLKRTQITHTPRVERILKLGEHAFPGATPAEILIGLAEHRANEIEPEATDLKPNGKPKVRNGIPQFTWGEGIITAEEAAQWIYESELADDLSCRY